MTVHALNCRSSPAPIPVKPKVGHAKAAQILRTERVLQCTRYPLFAAAPQQGRRERFRSRTKEHLGWHGAGATSATCAASASRSSWPAVPSQDLSFTAPRTEKTAHGDQEDQPERQRPAAGQGRSLHCRQLLASVQLMADGVHCQLSCISQINVAFFYCSCVCCLRPRTNGNAMR